LDLIRALLGSSEKVTMQAKNVTLLFI
jgi:hypothetical protein